ncbi:unnamed protein product [Phytophthora fragariaefolia]|uniref:Unnamed protein product n=1 Tax=Phytophthora fragariaefolia TaxID=1490495 RepID=A0A9W6X2I6_9STRA|nr:unnamed protein product [Phytophthora fragariaefolia]
MSLQDLAPHNTKRAQTTTHNIFIEFLVVEKTTMSFVRSVIRDDGSGAAFRKLKDRFAMLLKRQEQRSTEAQYCDVLLPQRQELVSRWQRPLIEHQLLKMCRMLERHCLKRLQGGTVTKAPACPKQDLHYLIDSIYFDATQAKDYQAVALLAIMWYAFGRASDITPV